MKDRELEARLRAIADDEPAPPPSLRARLESGIPDFPEQPEPWWSRGRWTMATVGTAASATILVAAAIWLALFVGPANQLAFAAVLEPVAQSTGAAQAVHLVMNVLTREGEDFGYVNLEGEPREVEVWVEWPQRLGDTGRARIDKEDRIYVFDGSDTIYFHPLRNEVYVDERGAGFGHELYWPAAWVRQIRNLPNDSVEVLEHDESGGRGRLLIREKGTPVAPLEPAFLGEFDRETEIEWDLESNRLTDLRRWVLVDGNRRLFSELVYIEYPRAIDDHVFELELVYIEYPRAIDDHVFELELPADVRRGGVPAGSVGLLELGPREVARRIFEAALHGNREQLELFCPSPGMVDWMLDDGTRPTEILFIGEPFRAGKYPGVFVPFSVRFGVETKTHNLALRNDNEQNRWVYDGGI